MLPFQNSKRKSKLLPLWLLTALMECYHSKDTCIPPLDTPSIFYCTCDFEILTHFPLPPQTNLLSLHDRIYQLREHQG